MNTFIHVLGGVAATVIVLCILILLVASTARLAQWIVGGGKDGVSERKQSRP